jgi:hypothetical protein
MSMADQKARKASEAVRTRRAFFRTVGLGGSAAGVLAAAKAVGVEAAEIRAPDAAGYRETEHVKTVYALARF